MRRGFIENGREGLTADHRPYRDHYIDSRSLVILSSSPFAFATSHCDSSEWPYPGCLRCLPMRPWPADTWPRLLATVSDCKLTDHRGGIERTVFSSSSTS